MWSTSVAGRRHGAPSFVHSQAGCRSNWRARRRRQSDPYPRCVVVPTPQATQRPGRDVTRRQPGHGCAVTIPARPRRRAAALDDRSWGRVEEELGRDRRLVIITGPGYGTSGDPGHRSPSTTVLSRRARSSRPSASTGPWTGWAMRGAGTSGSCSRRHGRTGAGRWPRSARPSRSTPGPSITCSACSSPSIGWPA